MYIECISKFNRSPANRLDLDEAICDLLVFALSLLLQDAWMGTGQSADGAVEAKDIHSHQCRFAGSCCVYGSLLSLLLIIMNCVFAIHTNIVALEGIFIVRVVRSICYYYVVKKMRRDYSNRPAAQDNQSMHLITHAASKSCEQWQVTSTYIALMHTQPYATAESILQAAHSSNLAPEYSEPCLIRRKRHYAQVLDLNHFK